MEIALPEIVKALHASVDLVMWVLMGYVLILTVLVPTVGRVADMYGRRKLYVSGFAVFSLGSLLSGLAQNGPELLALRLVQAVGGALMLANSTALVTDAFPRHELGKALGINGMAIAVGAVLGPIAGGFLAEMGWRWVFWFNVPLGVFGTLWAQLQLRELAILPEGQRFDWAGALTFMLGLLAILLGLTFGPIAGWFTPATAGCFVVGIVLLVAFVIIESSVDQPMLDLDLFRKRLLLSAYTSILLNGVARGAVTFLLVFYFVGVRSLNEMQAGLMLAPFAAAMMFTAPLSGALSDRYGSRGLSFLGLIVSGVGLWGLAHLTPVTPLWQLVTWMVIMGAGSGFFNSPNTNAIMGAVNPERRGIAAGTRTMMNNAGLVISMALGLAVTSSAISQEALGRLITHTQVGTAGISVGAFTRGMDKAFMVSLIMTLLAAVISLTRGAEPPRTAPSSLFR
ncbi:MAG TPA: MFS transporter [Firmicutes bacterium]|nr:MFS transporter [Bacillota bacterium]